MQMKYTALVSSFPRKTVIFRFELFDISLTDVCLYCNKEFLFLLGSLIEQKPENWQKCQFMIEIEFLLPVH